MPTTPDILGGSATDAVGCAPGPAARPRALVRRRASLEPPPRPGPRNAGTKPRLPRSVAKRHGRRVPRGGRRAADPVDAASSAHEAVGPAVDPMGPGNRLELGDAVRPAGPTPLAAADGVRLPTAGAAGRPRGRDPLTGRHRPDGRDDRPATPRPLADRRRGRSPSARSGDQPFDRSAPGPRRS